MSDSASEKPDATEAPSFIETDDQPTTFAYGKGGLPIPIALLWVGFIVVYVVVMSLLALPDLRAWMAQP